MSADDIFKEKRRAILLVAFGTSHAKARIAYANVERAVKTALPGEELRWAWTARTLLRSGEGPPRLSPQEALARLAAEGCKEVYILSLHVIPGAEWNDLAVTAAAFAGLPKGLEKVRLCGPLLYGGEATARLADLLLDTLPRQRKIDEAVVFVGHGTHHHSGVYYPALQYYLGVKDANVLVGTLEGGPSQAETLAALKASGARKVWLAPLMMVAGDHAANDLFGPAADSWQQVFAAAGLEVEPVRSGLGENPAVIELLVNNLKTLLEED